MTQGVNIRSQYRVPLIKPLLHARLFLCVIFLLAQCNNPAKAVLKGKWSKDINFPEATQIEEDVGCEPLCVP